MGMGSKLLTFCFCSHQKKFSVHVCTHWEIIFSWQLAPKGYATALHHSTSLQANSMYKFFIFGSWLAISWIYIWIVHTLFQQGIFFMHLLASLASHTLCCEGYGLQTTCLHALLWTYIYLFHIQHVLIHLYSTEVHKMPVAVILQWIHTLAL